MGSDALLLGSRACALFVCPPRDTKFERKYRISYYRISADSELYTLLYTVINLSGGGAFRQRQKDILRALINNKYLSKVTRTRTVREIEIVPTPYLLILGGMSSGPGGMASTRGGFYFSLAVRL